jgi:hypothetical protein
VGHLSAADVNQALLAGVQIAERLQKIGLIRSAALKLQGETRVVGSIPELSPSLVDERGLVHA